MNNIASDSQVLDLSMKKHQPTSNHEMARKSQPGTTSLRSKNYSESTDTTSGSIVTTNPAEPFEDSLRLVETFQEFRCRILAQLQSTIRETDDNMRRMANIGRTTIRDPEYWAKRGRNKENARRPRRAKRRREQERTTNQDMETSMCTEVSPNL